MGNGKNIRIQGDRWLPMGILHGPKTREEPLMVANLIDPIHHNWNRSLLLILGDQIIAEVLTIPVRPLVTEDQLVWTATKDGLYTVKSSYHNIKQATHNHHSNSASTSYQIPNLLW